MNGTLVFVIACVLWVVAWASLCQTIRGAGRDIAAALDRRISRNQDTD